MMNATCAGPLQASLCDLCNVAVSVYLSGKVFISGTWTLGNVACNHWRMQASTPGLNCIWLLVTASYLPS